MNILLLTTHFNIGGIGRYLLNLSEGLIKRGHRIIIASSKGDFVSTLHKEVCFFPLNIRTKSELSPKIFFAIPKLIKLIKEKEIEIIHCQTRVSQVLAFYLSKITHLSYLTTCHGFFKPHLGRILFPCWGEKIIAISQPVKEHLLKDFKIAPSRIALIPNGVQKKERLPLADVLALREKYGLREKGDVIGIIARLSAVKGIEYLIMAMSKVLKTKPDAQLVIVGEGKTEQKLKSLSKELGIAAQVFFLGTISNVEEILSTLNIFVLPSLQEGLGLSLLEAMAMAKPVVACDVGGISDIITSRENGLLVPPRDAQKLAYAIRQILEDKEMAAEMGKKARETVEKKFSLEKMVGETERVYREIV